MKYKLKELYLDINNFSFNKHENIINFKYKNECLEFQTPKIIIDSLIKENNNEYIVCKIIGNKSCEIFFSKISMLESLFNKHFKTDVKSIFNNDSFIVKIPFRYSKPQIDVYKNNSLFNYYRVIKGMEIICLVYINKLWVNSDNEINYHLNVKEILII